MDRSDICHSGGTMLSSALTGQGLGVGEGEEDRVDREVVEAFDEKGQHGIGAKDQKAQEKEVEVEKKGGRQQEEDDREQQRAQEELVHIVRVGVDALS